MDIDLAALPSDIDTLHQLVRDLATQIADDQSELAQAQAEIERLKLIIRRFQRAQFGRRSERIDGDQLALGLEDLDADVARLQARHPAALVHDVGSQPTSRRDFPTICLAKMWRSILMSASVPTAVARDLNIIADGPAQSLHPLQKCSVADLHVRIVRCVGHERAHAPHGLALLRSRRERPRHRAAEQRDEVAPVHCRSLPCFRAKG